MAEKQSSRRDLLKLKVTPSAAPDEETPSILQEQEQSSFQAGSTIRVATRAMACEFSVILNPGRPEHLLPAGEMLQAVHEMESWLSIYRSHSEISLVNQQAAEQPVRVRRQFVELLQLAQKLHQMTDQAFDMTTGSLIQLWRQCRQQKTIPAESQIAAALEQTGTQHLTIDEESSSVHFARPGLKLDPGAIGKGFALDEVAAWLAKTENAPTEYLLHGGHSSLLGRGSHYGLPGWPVGIGNPLFTNKRLGMVLVCDQAMSTSGSNIQFYRHEGRRYGHILDPKTGWPVEGMLSVTVLADSAAVADALSTAFFVLGIEKARQCCENLENIGVILVPFPEHGRRVQPVVIGISGDRIRWDADQVV